MKKVGTSNTHGLHDHDLYDEEWSAAEQWAIYRDAYSMFGGLDGIITIAYSSPDPNDASPLSGLSDFEAARSLRHLLTQIYQPENVQLIRSPMKEVDSDVFMDHWLDVVEKGPLIVICGPRRNKYGAVANHLLTHPAIDSRGWKFEWPDSKNSQTPDRINFGVFDNWNTSCNWTFSLSMKNAGRHHAPWNKTIGLEEFEQLDIKKGSSGKNYKEVSHGMILRTNLVKRQDGKEVDKRRFYWLAGQNLLGTSGAVRLLLCKKVLAGLGVFSENFCAEVAARGSTEKRSAFILHSAMIRGVDAEHPPKANSNPFKNSPVNPDLAVTQASDTGLITTFRPFRDHLSDTRCFQIVPFRKFFLTEDTEWESFLREESGQPHLGEHALLFAPIFSTVTNEADKKNRIIGYQLLSSKEKSHEVSEPKSEWLSNDFDRLNQLLLWDDNMGTSHIEEVKQLIENTLSKSIVRFFVPVSYETLRAFSGVPRFRKKDTPHLGEETVSKKIKWFPKTRLVIEVIDPQEIPDLNEFEEVAQQYYKANISLAVTVASSDQLFSVMGLSAEFLKIKWSRRDIIADKKSYRIFLQRISHYARRMGKHVIVEGIERQADIQDLLRIKIPFFMKEFPTNPHEHLLSSLKAE